MKAKESDLIIHPLIYAVEPVEFQNNFSGQSKIILFKRVVMRPYAYIRSAVKATNLTKNRSPLFQQYFFTNF